MQSPGGNPESRQDSRSTIDSQGVQKKVKPSLLTSSSLHATSDTPRGQQRFPIVTTASQRWQQAPVNPTKVGHSAPLTPDGHERSDSQLSGQSGAHLHNESQLIKLMEKQSQQLEDIQNQLDFSAPGISEQQFKRLDELLKRHIEEALQAATLHVSQSYTSVSQSHTSTVKRHIEEVSQSNTSIIKSHIEDALQNSTYASQSQEANGQGKRIPLCRTPNEAESPVPMDVANGVSTDEATKPPAAKRNAHANLKTTINQVLDMGQSEHNESDHSWQMRAFERATRKTSSFVEVLDRHGVPTWLVPRTRPDNLLVHSIDMPWFHAITVFAILANTVFSAYQAHSLVIMALESQAEAPEWWNHVDLAFTIYFIVELLLRMIALRAYFFFERGKRVWNILDLIVCTISVVATNFDIVFIRMLRIFRLFRLLRVLSENKALVALRNLLFSVVACLIPLFWAVVFLVMTMLMFTLLIMQCLSANLNSLRFNTKLRYEVDTYFYGFQGCLKTLFTAVVGDDWVEAHDILSTQGWLPSLVMPMFVVFVNIGVMNVVIGVFADAADGVKDRQSIAEAEMDAAVAFSRDMVSLVFETCGIDSQGTLGWEQFQALFYQEGVQAYLSYHGLDSSHVKLVYHLLDGSDDGCQDGAVDLKEFVIGMLSLKGMAKRLDQQVTLQALHTLVQDVQIMRAGMERRGGEDGGMSTI